ncbi:Ricin-type beta-trefoil lectin domain-like [Nonomuraea solani]|uniref:Ricin-type beta-trefoil lectin domain-like n=1 Tax=Nonomuraea solani TaxID=1144553 RepID=A0A1H6F1A0_9ACTN|nr:RICIN domain-containing protein [Nonomuraea solani]SEH02969.1 Ricin-type beta-trefoil lectin domain-like [Nonomuraea solani]
MRSTWIRNAIGTAAAGALLVALSPSVAHAEPRWNLVPPSGERAEAVAPSIINYNSRMVLQPTGSSTANGARVVQSLYSGSSFQTWTRVLDGSYSSFDNGGSRKNLGIDRASTAAGANAIQANPAGDTNQDWYLDDAAYPGNWFAMKNRKSGLCLGISGGSTGSGGQAAQFSCDGRANQRWALGVPA